MRFSTVRIEALSWRCWTRRMRQRTVLLTVGRRDVVLLAEEDVIEMIGLVDLEVEIFPAIDAWMVLSETWVPVPGM